MVPAPKLVPETHPTPLLRWEEKENIASGQYMTFFQDNGCFPQLHVNKHTHMKKMLVLAPVSFVPT